MSLSENIKKARTRQKMTQEQLAKHLNKSKNVISNWERGDNKPDAESILQLCTLLNMDPNTLLDWQRTEEYHLSFDEKNIINNYRNIEDWQKNTLKSVLEDFVEHSQIHELIPTRFVPLYTISPSAGIGNYLYEDLDSEQIEIKDTQENKHVDYILKVDGHSMEPKFQDGSYVKVKIQNSILPHEIGIFTIDGTSFIKQYEVDHLHSINPDYEDIQLQEDMYIRCEGKVLGIYND